MKRIALCGTHVGGESSLAHKSNSQNNARMFHPRTLTLLVLGLILARTLSAAQDTPKIYKDHVTPHWFANNSKFWYANDLPQGKQEFFIVDATQGSRERANRAPDTNDQAGALPQGNSIHASSQGGAETRITFRNQRSSPVELFWVDTANARPS